MDFVLGESVQWGEGFTVSTLLGVVLFPIMDARMTVKSSVSVLGVE